MIIFVGKEGNGYFVKEVAESMRKEVTFIAPKSSIKEQMNDILLAAKEGAELIIYDVEEYIDEPETIVNQIVSIKKTNNVKPAILAPTLSEKNVILKGCIDNGIKDFIASYETSSQKKEQLIKIITEFYDANGRPEVDRIKQAVEEDKLIQQSYKTIAVAGSCHRMGTTTQAIQITKYLTFKGYKACYIEMNSNKYINRTLIERGTDMSFTEKLRTTFEAEFLNENLGVMKYEGVDMLYNQDKLYELLRSGYDFFIYDYGVYNDKGFNKAAFLKDERRFFVVGSDATELDYTIDVAQNYSYRDCDFIFSFVAKEEWPDVIKVMDSARNVEKGASESKCFFTDYTPSPYILSNIELYERMFTGLELKEGSPAALLSVKADEPEKKGLFGRRKKK